MKTLIFFCCILFQNEKATPSSWELKSFLRLMNEKHPQTIVADQDLGLTEAIANEMPYTKHAFCIWLYDLDNIKEFELQWNELIVKFDLESDRHIKLRYLNRTSWTLSYLKEYFLAGITTTGCSKFINAHLKRFLHARTSLKEFIDQVGTAVSIRNHVGEEVTMKQKYYIHHIKTFMSIEKHASKDLTPFAFKLLQDEMILSLEYGLFSDNDGSYIVRHYSKINRGHFVY
ncbi:hypothetical protein P3S68_001561 [Capsicum galapagoense]